MGTLAYLADTASAKNTFTVGKVDIDLDETDVDIMGKKDGDARVTANSYKLLPGLTYTKDPVVHVLKGSEKAYVRLQVTITNATNAAKALVTTEDGIILLENYVDENYVNWTFKGATKGNDTITYEFWYNDIVDASAAQKDLEALFTTITMPGDLTNEQIANLEGVEVNVVAHAKVLDTVTKRVCALLLRRCLACWLGRRYYCISGYRDESCG